MPTETPRRIEWIRDTESLESLLKRSGGGTLAVDCEADSLHHYPDKVCLVQLSVDGADYLVDPLAGVDLGRLGPVLADPAVRKVFHGADYDLRILDRDYGLEVRGLFDTMIAARLVGERSFGLAALLGKHLDVEVDKRFQRADWSRRPLTAEMERYAAMDTRYLGRLTDGFEQRLEELGRTSWAAEEFGRIEQVRWNRNAKDEAWKKVKGAGRLDRRQLAIVRELWRWREEAARARDRPPFMILRDAVMIDLAQRRPRDSGELAKIRGMPRGWADGRRGRELLRAIASGEELDAEELPHGPKRRKPRATGSDERLGALRQERDRLAEELDLEPSVVATRGALESLLARGNGRPVEPAPELRAWQRDLLAPALKRIVG
jgi:ribonuclease D